MEQAAIYLPARFISDLRLSYIGPTRHHDPQLDIALLHNNRRERQDRDD